MERNGGDEHTTGHVNIPATHSENRQIVLYRYGLPVTGPDQIVSLLSILDLDMTESYYGLLITINPLLNLPIIVNTRLTHKSSNLLMFVG